VTIPGSTPGAAKCIDGATPPSAPMCATITIPDGGTPVPDSGSGRPDAAPDTGGRRIGHGRRGPRGRREQWDFRRRWRDRGKQWNRRQRRQRRE
jgi:hypothetical protein